MAALVVASPFPGGSTPCSHAAFQQQQHNSSTHTPLTEPTGFASKSLVLDEEIRLQQQRLQHMLRLRQQQLDDCSQAQHERELLQQRQLFTELRLQQEPLADSTSFTQRAFQSAAVSPALTYGDIPSGSVQQHLLVLPSACLQQPLQRNWGYIPQQSQQREEQRHHQHQRYQDAEHQQKLPIISHIVSLQPYLFEDEAQHNREVFSPSRELTGAQTQKEAWPTAAASGVVSAQQPQAGSISSSTSSTTGYDETPHIIPVQLAHISPLISAASPVLQQVALLVTSPSERRRKPLNVQQEDEKSPTSDSSALGTAASASKKVTLQTQQKFRAKKPLQDSSSSPLTSVAQLPSLTTQYATAAPSSTAAEKKSSSSRQLQQYTSAQEKDTFCGNVTEVASQAAALFSSTADKFSSETVTAADTFVVATATASGGNDAVNKEQVREPYQKKSTSKKLKNCYGSADANEEVTQSLFTVLSEKVETDDEVEAAAAHTNVTFSESQAGGRTESELKRQSDAAKRLDLSRAISQQLSSSSLPRGTESVVLEEIEEILHQEQQRKEKLQLQLCSQSPQATVQNWQHCSRSSSRGVQRRTEEEEGLPHRTVEENYGNSLSLSNTQSRQLKHSNNSSRGSSEACDEDHGRESEWRRLQFLSEKVKQQEEEKRSMQEENFQVEQILKRQYYQDMQTKETERQHLALQLQQQVQQSDALRRRLAAAAQQQKRLKFAVDVAQDALEQCVDTMLRPPCQTAKQTQGHHSCSIETHCDFFAGQSFDKSGKEQLERQQHQQHQKKTQLEQQQQQHLEGLPTLASGSELTRLKEEGEAVSQKIFSLVDELKKSLKALEGGRLGSDEEEALATAFQQVCVEASSLQTPVTASGDSQISDNKSPHHSAGMSDIHNTEHRGTLRKKKDGLDATNEHVNEEGSNGEKRSCIERCSSCKAKKEDGMEADGFGQLQQLHAEVAALRANLKAFTECVLTAHRKSASQTSGASVSMAKTTGTVGTELSTFEEKHHALQAATLPEAGRLMLQRLEELQTLNARLLADNKVLQQVCGCRYPGATSAYNTPLMKSAENESVAETHQLRNVCGHQPLLTGPSYFSRSATTADAVSSAAAAAACSPDSVCKRDMHLDNGQRSCSPLVAPLQPFSPVFAALENNNRVQRVLVRSDAFDSPAVAHPMRSAPVSTASAHPRSASSSCAFESQKTRTPSQRDFFPSALLTSGRDSPFQFQVVPGLPRALWRADAGKPAAALSDFISRPLEPRQQHLQPLSRCSTDQLLQQQHGLGIFKPKQSPILQHASRLGPTLALSQQQPVPLEAVAGAPPPPVLVGSSKRLLSPPLEPIDKFVVGGKDASMLGSRTISHPKLVQQQQQQITRSRAPSFTCYIGSNLPRLPGRQRAKSISVGASNSVYSADQKQLRQQHALYRAMNPSASAAQLPLLKKQAQRNLAPSASGTVKLQVSRHERWGSSVEGSNVKRGEMRALPAAALRSNKSILQQSNHTEQSANTNVYDSFIKGLSPKVLPVEPGAEGARMNLTVRGRNCARGERNPVAIHEANVSAAVTDPAPPLAAVPLAEAASWKVFQRTRRNSVNSHTASLRAFPPSSESGNLSHAHSSPSLLEDNENPRRRRERSSFCGVNRCSWHEGAVVRVGQKSPFFTDEKSGVSDADKGFFIKNLRHPISSNTSNFRVKSVNSSVPFDIETRVKSSTSLPAVKRNGEGADGKSTNSKLIRNVENSFTPSLTAVTVIPTHFFPNAKTMPVVAVSPETKISRNALVTRPLQVTENIGSASHERHFSSFHKSTLWQAGNIQQKQIQQQVLAGNYSNGYLGSTYCCVQPTTTGAAPLCTLPR